MSKEKLSDKGIIVDEAGSWILHKCAISKDKATIDTAVYLIEAEKSDSIAINLVNKSGKTALHSAAECGNYRMVDSLLKRMVLEVVVLKDKFGKTALDYAKNQDIVNKLTTYVEEHTKLLASEEASETAHTTFEISDTFSDLQDINVKVIGSAECSG